MTTIMIMTMTMIMTMALRMILTYRFRMARSMSMTDICKKSPASLDKSGFKDYTIFHIVKSEKR